MVFNHNIGKRGPAPPASVRGAIFFDARARHCRNKPVDYRNLNQARLERPIHKYKGAHYCPWKK